MNSYQNKKMDTLAEILWYLVFLTPLFTIPWALRIPDTKLIFRVVIGLGFALSLSFVFLYGSLAILDVSLMN